MSSSYSHAVLDPFSPEADGAQVPDLYSFPTSTTHIKTSFSVASDSLGNFDFAFLPSILASIYSNNQNLLGQLAQSLAYPVPIVANGAPSAPSINASINSVISPTQVQEFDLYRIVGAGLRMRSMLIPQTSTGTMYCCSQVAGPKTLNVTQQTAVNLCTGGNTVGGTSIFARQYINHFPRISPQTLTITAPIAGTVSYFDQSFQSQPTGAVFEHYALNNHGLEVHLRPVSPKAFEWRSGSNQSVLAKNATTVSYYGQDDALNVTVATGAVSANAGALDASITEGIADETGGWNAYYFRGFGFPANVTVFTCELIYHLEYIPLSASSVNFGKFPPVNKEELDEVADAAAVSPFYKPIDTNVQGQIAARLGF